MKLVHSNIETSEAKPKKQVPLHKNKAAIIALAKQLVRENNERLLRNQGK